MRIKCPSCATVLSIPESAAGKVVKCPCGTQLRAPAKAAGFASAPSGPRATAPLQRAKAPRRPAPAQPDAGLFDELTEKDLRPSHSPTEESTKPAQPSAASKLLQQAAADQKRVARFRVGPKASPWTRFGAALVDGLVIGLLAAPVLVVCMVFLVPMFVDVRALENTEGMDQAQRDALLAQVTRGFVTAYSVSAALAYILPIVVYAVMLTNSGQTPGKKVCKIRVVDGQTKALAGFVRTVLLRSWMFNVLYGIPLLGAVLWIVDHCMIFGDDRTCLHDRVAGTIVVQSS